MAEELTGDQGPVVYEPDEAAVSQGEDGRRMVFFTVPEAELMIKRVLADSPKEYSYRWAYHPSLRTHFLLFGWPSGEGAALALEEERWSGILNQMLGTTDIYLTIYPVAERIGAGAPREAVQKVQNGLTVWLPGVKFKPEGA